MGPHPWRAPSPLHPGLGFSVHAASAPTYLVRDNVRAYGHVFISRVSAMGIRDSPISPGSPWQNGIAERLIGTLRRECLDRILIFGESHLRRVLSAYANSDNGIRPLDCATQGCIFL
jgi:transposase InsO family protein